MANLPNQTGPETDEGFPLGCGAFQPAMLERIDLPSGEIAYLPVTSKPSTKSFHADERGRVRGVEDVGLPEEG